MKKIALVGYGYWGPNLLRNFYEMDSCEVLYVCDRDLARLKLVRKRYPSVMLTANYEDVLNDNDIDAVVVATPTKFHFELAKKALLAGKDVLIEKPMTTTSIEALELTRIAGKTKRVLMVDHTFLFTQAVRKLKEIIDKGILGKIIYIDSVRVNLGLLQKDSNVIFDLATHDVSILKFLLGADPVKISAEGHKFFGSQEEIAYVHLHYPGGLTANLHVSWLSPLKIRRMMVVGARKMAVYDDIEQSEKIKLYDKGVEFDKTQLRIGYRSGDVYSPNLEIKEGLATMCAEFIAAIEKRKSPISDGKFAYAVVSVLEEASNLAKNVNRKERKNR